MRSGHEADAHRARERGGGPPAIEGGSTHARLLVAIVCRRAAAHEAYQFGQASLARHLVFRVTPFQDRADPCNKVLSKSFKAQRPRGIAQP
ncbi:hypothetical protein AX27061_0401 [Achromobacter xylosoxidans NBRC 15126 = ATCC 27061]|nr:hypothetical protein AX27061_0401 [Achromobacter xylosoxidans NBRC 15126 = ATCC 27061]